MLLFKEAGEIRNADPASAEAQDLVKRIQNFIMENMYTWSNNIFQDARKQSALINIDLVL